MFKTLHLTHVSATTATFTAEPPVRLPSGDLVPQAFTRGPVISISDQRERLGLPALSLGEQYRVSIEAVSDGF